MTEYMGIDPIQNIRIQSKLNDKRGCTVSVTDADTGENIHNITRVVVIIEPRNLNQAIVTYNKVDGQGAIVAGEEGKPVKQAETLDNPEIDTSALVLPDKVVGKALALWDLAKGLGERAKFSAYGCPFCVPERDSVGFYLHRSNCPISRAARLTRGDEQ